MQKKAAEEELQRLQDAEKAAKEAEAERKLEEKKAAEEAQRLEEEQKAKLVEEMKEQKKALEEKIQQLQSKANNAPKEVEAAKKKAAEEAHRLREEEKEARLHPKHWIPEDIDVDTSDEEENAKKGVFQDTKALIDEIPDLLPNDLAGMDKDVAIERLLEAGSFLNPPGTLHGV